jgi:exopolysaccharide production protein ExoZ
MIRNIEVLRAVAALLVVFCHLGEVSRTLGVFPFAGYTGVDLFFVISGFVMAHTTLAHSTSGEPIGPWPFLRNRIARIVPLYWLMTLAVYAIAVFAPSWLRTTTADPVFLIKSLLFIPYPTPDRPMEPILYVGWTLNIEMAFYAMYAVGLFARRPLAGLAAVFAVLVVLTLCGFIWPTNANLLSLYTTPRMLEFGLGMILALLLDKAPRTASLGAKSAALAAAILFIPVLVFAPYALPDALLITAATPAVIVVACALLLERWGWRWNGGLALKLGAASYAMYLSHLFVTVPIRMIAHRLQPGPLVTASLIIGGLIVASLVALAIHRWIDKPLMAWARRLLHTRRMEPQPA